MSWGVACCPTCETRPPLISTIVFPKFEFYCLDCGGKFGFLDPISRHGPEIEALLVQYQQEWDDNVGANLVGRFWKQSCELCKPMRDYHIDHATPEQIAVDKAAREWMMQRVKVTA